MSLGGAPWTQFRFVDEEGNRDALFYRIDGWKESAFFSLRQYQRDPIPDVESKRRRFDQLRRSWLEAWSSAGAANHLQLRPVRGKKEIEIARISLKTTSTSTVRAALAEVHPTFIANLEA